MVDYEDKTTLITLAAIKKKHQNDKNVKQVPYFNSPKSHFSRWCFLIDVEFKVFKGSTHNTDDNTLVTFNKPKVKVKQV